MPAAATRLPVRAVFGELKNLMPRMNKTETPMRIKAMVELMLFLFLEHLQHAVRDHESAEDVGRTENHRDKSQRLRERACAASASTRMPPNKMMP